MIVVAQTGDESVRVKQCLITYKKSGTALPLIDLDAMGPEFTLDVRRHRLPPPAVRREVKTLNPKCPQIKTKP